jgi:hypothetical protein
VLPRSFPGGTEGALKGLSDDAIEGHCVDRTIALH